MSGVQPTTVRTASDEVQEWLRAYGADEVRPAALLCDRYAGDPSRLALRYEDAAGNRRELSYAELRDLSSRCAGVLRSLGVGPGDRVATLLPKSPELMIATLAIWRLGAAHVPLFTAFGPQAISYRLQGSAARAFVTDSANRAKLDGAGVPLPRIITVTSDGVPREGDLDFWPTLESAAPVSEPAAVLGDAPMIVIYTSGTTGQPKGVQIPVRALAAFEAYMRFGIELRPDDVFWNIADPGWAYGLYYALIGPLLLGQTTLFYNAPFNAADTYRVLRDYGITNFAAAPTVYRALRSSGEQPEGVKLRVLSSAGEPLNPDVVSWASETLGAPLHDHYGQTEVGMVANNHHRPDLQRPLRPGSMGHAMPGFRVVVIDEEGREAGPGQEGQIAIDVPASPLFPFGGYLGEPERTRDRYTRDGRFYLTGDSASQDADGYTFFSGRSDDIIISAGYRIGPFEVESALIGHPAVAEAAVVGKPDELRGEIVIAYVVLRSGFAPSEELIPIPGDCGGNNATLSCDQTGG